MRAWAMSVFIAAVVATTPPLCHPARSQEPVRAAVRSDSAPANSAIPGYKLTLDLTGYLEFATQKVQHYEATGWWIVFPGEGATGWHLGKSTLGLTSAFDQKQKGSDPPVISRKHSAWVQQAVMFPGDRFYGDLEARALINSLLGIRLQQSYHAALGTELGPWEMDLGPAYVAQDFGSAAPFHSFWGVYFGEQAGWRISARGVDVTQNVRVIVPFQGVSSYWQLSGQAAVYVNVVTPVSVWLKIFEDQVANVPPSFKRNYLRTEAGISLKFGRT